VCPSVPPASFPNLARGNHEDKSPLDKRYNCIAYAAAVDSKWWWPDANGIGYWPPGVPREETQAAFIQAYETKGYAVCSDDSFEDGYEKVAIYVNPDNNIPTHAARQILAGKWVSKIGEAEDIEHETLNVVEGPLYGIAMIYMKRQRAG
jgi:hypothetical protein